MLTIRPLKFIMAVLITAGAIAVVAVSRLWRYPAENSFLIAFISVPFVLFFVPTFLARRQFTLLMSVGFLLAAICVGIFQYTHEVGGPEIPTMYFGVPVIRAFLRFWPL